MRKKKLILIISYILLSTLLVFYIRSILKRDDLKIYIEKEIKLEKTVRVNVTLKINIRGTISEYSHNFENIDTVEELLLKVRGSGEITYEVTKYTSGIKINSVNGITPSDNFEWAVFKNDENITGRIDKISLEDGQIYELKMIQK